MARRSFLQRVKRAWRELSPQATVASAPIYSGAQTGRLFADWITSLLHPDDELKGSIRTLRARAREMDRNNGLAHRFLSLLEINVIGPSGLTLAAQVRDAKGQLNKTVNSQLEAAWYEWSSGPVSLDETLDLVGLQQLLVRTVAMDGEAFVRFRRSKSHPFGLALEPIDADQVDDNLNRQRSSTQNEIRLGVEIDTGGRRVAYHASDRPLSMTGTRKLERIPAEDVVHLYMPRRVNQTRGVTWFSPSMWAMRQESGYTEAELVAARIASAKMGFFSQKGDDAFTADAEEQDTDDGGFKTEVEPGIFSVLPRGYEFTGFDPQHPTTAYEAFTKTIIRRIASAFGVSYEALSNDRASSSYSSARTGLMLERDVMRRLQSWWSFVLLRRLYAEWLNMALLTGALQLPSRDATKFLAVKWMPRGWDWVDPLNDVQAAALAIQHGLASRKQYLAERGLDVEEVFEELAEESRMAEEKGISLSTSASLAASSGKPEPDDTDNETSAGEKPRAALLEALTNGNGAHAPAGR